MAGKPRALLAACCFNGAGGTAFTALGEVADGTVFLECDCDGDDFAAGTPCILFWRCRSTGGGVISPLLGEAADLAVLCLDWGGDGVEISDFPWPQAVLQRWGVGGAASVEDAAEAVAVEAVAVEAVAVEDAVAVEAVAVEADAAEAVALEAAAEAAVDVCLAIAVALAAAVFAVTRGMGGACLQPLSS